MTTKKLYKLMEDPKLGYACVYKLDGNGKHTDFLFPMTPTNIANFIGANAFTAEKIVMTDLADRLICESAFGGFLMDCPDQSLRTKIVPHLEAIQMGEKEPKEIAAATREEMEAVWAAEEEAVMEAEIRML